MRIGIFLGLNPTDGGIYQYSLTMLEALRDCTTEFKEDEFVAIGGVSDDALRESLQAMGWSTLPLLPSTFKRSLVRFAERIVGPAPKRMVLALRGRLSSQKKQNVDLNKVTYNLELERWFRANLIDLIIYPISISLSFETRIPYILAVHDLQHRLQPEFPEVSANGEWESREYLFRNGIRNATLVLADSDVGKEDILKFYGALLPEHELVKVLPFLPSCTVKPDVDEVDLANIRERYSLPERYLFYPAQFWPHKNHRRIVEALGKLKQTYGLEIPIVFCGSYGGAIRERNYKQIMAMAEEVNISKQIRYLGYVPDEDMAGLYAGAVALIMPTFFGPTNIPILEAWGLDCPVLTSDIRGVREQAQDAAILVDPRSVEAIADGIRRLWTDGDFRRVLVERGRRQLRTFTPFDFRVRLVEILNEAKARVVNGNGQILSS